MIQDAEDKGLLTPGVSTIIEPTSGNTGIGLAMASAVRGYRCIIVLPEKNSDEKVNTLTALGAEIVRTRTEAKFNEPDSLVAVAQRLQKEIPNSVILNQYTNSGNPLAHYDGTGAEILYQLDNKVDMVVLGAGTGGTVTGVGRQIKEVCPDCKIVAVDPEGSILARPESLNNSDVVVYDVEGIGYDFIPTVLDHSVVDQWVKSNDAMALPISRRLIREEGFLCGGSSGAAMSVALKVAQELREDQTCVVICPDNIRNYMTKFVVDQWMEARNLKESLNIHFHSWWDRKVSDMIAEIKEHQLILPTTSTCQEVIQNMKNKNVEQIPIVNEKGDLEGIATVNFLMNKMLDTSLNNTDQIQKALFKKFVKVNCETNVGRLSRILEKEPFVVVACCENNDEQEENQNNSMGKKSFAIVTQKDMFNYLSSV
ncbi:CLUMA_CG009943, isoform A [Clunio marinus]|uniref:cystathionine beta-synthase n=1 Tax=Clunio marinus TaxID=568069 RepID=A0A1J1I938_9DIPT|nr:CLUMA_CG009943, isoform A [Clunio marinus]